MARDEFSTYFERSYVPKVLITTDDVPCRRTRGFVKVFILLIG